MNLKCPQETILLSNLYSVTPRCKNYIKLLLVFLIEEKERRLYKLAK